VNDPLLQLLIMALKNDPEYPQTFHYKFLKQQLKCLTQVGRRKEDQK